MEWLTTSARLAAKIFEEEKDQMDFFFALTFITVVLFLGILHLNSFVSSF